MNNTKRKKPIRTLLIILLSLVALFVLALGGTLIYGLNFKEPAMAKVWKAGYVEKTFTVGDTTLNYAEGPDNGPALLLIHGQSVLWKSYQLVLPELSEYFHVYAVDCHGHGESSKNPEDYNVEAMGEDFAAFIDQVIAEPVIVTGNSSGGLLAVWLGANAPKHIVGIMPEDPPLFSSEYPRIIDTFGYDLPNTANSYINSGTEEEFLDYYIQNSKMMDFFGDSKNGVYNWVQTYRKQNPDEAVNVFFLPLSMRLMFVGMDTYDPYFGEAFYTGEWHKNFDHAETLQRIEVPVLLIHANWYYEDGILMGAMSDEDAAQADELMPNSELVKVDSGHSVHVEKPEEFVQLLVDFANDLGVRDK